MDGTWSLHVLYDSFEDEAFQNDINQIEEKIDRLQADILRWIKEPDKETALKRIISAQEKFTVYFLNLASYVSLKQNANTNDKNAVRYMEKLDRAQSGVSRVEAIINRFIASLDNLDDWIKKDGLGEYRFRFKRIKQFAVHLLPNEMEDLLAKMNVTGGQAFSHLQHYLTSNLDVEYQGKVTTLSAIRNFAYSADPQERKSAYEAELGAYEKIEDSIAFALNNIKAQVNMEAELRGYDSPLGMTLEQSNMSFKTLTAMWEAIRAYLPKFQAYLKRKAQMLGHAKGLPWYDLFAPLGREERKFSIEDARKYLVEHFQSFDSEFARMVETAFEDNWIDFYPRKGKVGGAFCENLPWVKQSRILTNFDGSLGNVVTLAHELGHAYHGLQIENHCPLNWDYPMPVAETASTFSENIIMLAAIEEAEKEEKIYLLESKIRDTTQIICDIYSRYLFESAVFEKRRDAFLFAGDLKQEMIKAQKQAYGDGLEEDCLHPYMWICKGHYYSPELSFYNFPYAFGGLFAMGLYAQYVKEGPEFVPKYKLLLRATTVNTVEEVAKLAGIDLTTRAFWQDSLDLVAEQIDAFLELTKDRAGM